MMSHKKGTSGMLVPFFIVGFIASYLCISRLAFAEVPVVEIEDRQSVTEVRASPSAASPGSSSSGYSQTTLPSPAGSRQNQLSEIFTQMQELQREVQELRGLTEQQSFEIQTLKQQAKDNYVDLDRRMGALQAGAVSTNNNNATSGTTPTNTSVDTLAAGAEKESYDAALKLINQSSKDEAIAAFHQHIKVYPEGEYTPNAYYWLGQIYFTQGQNDAAEIEFSHLLKYYPDHRKAADAKFKIGQIYFKQGKKAEAKKLIQEVAAGSVEESRLAQTFLKDNF